MFSRLSNYRSQFQCYLDQQLEQLKHHEQVAPLLQQAMQYVMTGPGKRLRPCLVYATGESLNIEINQLHPAALAVEMIHIYSLIHDDLPCMDNAKFRHGRPSCHRQFNVAVAMLAGNALQSWAFEQLVNLPPLSQTQTNQSIRTLNQACGANGLMSGQMQDLYPPKPTTPEDLLNCYRQKTGALLAASLQLPWIIKHSSNTGELPILQSLGETLGILYQLQDDWQDRYASTATTGKDAQLDEGNNTCSFLRLFGEEAVHQCYQHQYSMLQETLNHLDLPSAAIADVISAMIAPSLSKADSTPIQAS